MNYLFCQFYYRIFLLLMNCPFYLFFVLLSTVPTVSQSPCLSPSPILEKIKQLYFEVCRLRNSVRKYAFLYVFFYLFVCFYICSFCSATFLFCLLKHLYVSVFCFCVLCRDDVLIINPNCPCTIGQIAETFRPTGFLCSFTVSVGTFLLGRKFKGSTKLVAPYVVSVCTFHPFFRHFLYM